MIADLVPYDLVDIIPPPLRASTLICRLVRDWAGNDLGRITYLETCRHLDGREEIVAVTAGRRGRLLGYERRRGDGRWLLEMFAHRVIRRDTRRIPWSAPQM